MGNNKFIKNTGWLLDGNLMRMIFQFVINIFIARYLGPEKQGILNYVATYTSLFTLLVSMGINGVIIHEFVNHEKDENKIIGTAITLRLIIAAVSVIMMVVVVSLSNQGDSEIRNIAILQAIQLPFAAFDTIKYWYNRHLKSRISVIVTTIAYALSSVYKLYILVAQKDLFWFGFATSLDIILIGILYLVSYKREGGKRLCFQKEAAARMIKAALPFTLANVMMFVYSKIDTIMIRHMLDSMELVGYYSTAVAVCGYISFVPTAILDSARPLIMEAKTNDQEQYTKRLRQSTIGVVLVAVLYALFLTLFGRFVINLLYGEAYLGSVNSLRIAVWYTGFSFIGAVKSIWLICEGKNKYVFLFSVLGALTDVILNLLMIPVWGIEGAALATLITQACTHIVYPLLIPQTRDFVKMVWDAIRLRNIDAAQMISALKKKLTKK